MQVEVSLEKTTKTKAALVQEEVRRRQERIKYNFKGIWPETKIAFAWSKIADTNMGHVDYDDFQQRMFGKDPTPLA